MKGTIRNKLILGCTCLLLVMSGVAGVGNYALQRVKGEAREAIGIGDRLNLIAIEIQVHNLEAQRRVNSYLAEGKETGQREARAQNLEEANFEIHEMEALAARALAISPDAQKRAKFTTLRESLILYRQALDSVIRLAAEGGPPAARKNGEARYELAADQLHQNAEDGEVAGSDASQRSAAAIEQTSGRASSLAIGIYLIGLVAGVGMSFALSRSILGPVDHLRRLAETASQGNLQIEVRRFTDDEIGDLSESFSRLLASVRFFQAKTEMLNEQLKAENVRMGAELEVTRRLQQMMLPREADMRGIGSLDISGYMEPAAEVGGDYYDVVARDGGVFFGIGDVTGHGLESGVIGIILQTAVRTLLACGKYESGQFFDVLNRVICDNTRRMNCDRVLTFNLLRYQDGMVTISGQHEEILVVRKDGAVERHDTLDLGFPLGLEEDISRFVKEARVPLREGDVMVAYTDGITEAIDQAGFAYGVGRLAEAIRGNYTQSSDEIRNAVLKNLRGYVGECHLLDDISLLVIKPAGAVVTHPA